jgi:hypothetical protein
MTIVNVGLSHRFAPAEMLEKLVVPSAELGDVLTRLRTVPAVDQVVVLSTGNRVEIYAAASGPAEQVTQAVAGLMASRGAVPTRVAVITERSFLATLDAGCGALSELVAEAGGEPAVRLSGLIAAPDGSSVVRAQATGAVADGDALGRRLAHLLLEHGGAALLDRTSHGVTEPRSRASGGVSRCVV